MYNCLHLWVHRAARIVNGEMLLGLGLYLEAQMEDTFPANPMKQYTGDSAELRPA